MTNIMPQALSLGAAPYAVFRPCDFVVHRDICGFCGFYDFRSCFTYNEIALFGDLLDSEQSISFEAVLPIMRLHFLVIY
ncbi:hypothetical protein NY2A_B884L [Paramecium bursaria Chlorella virus NY2A]|uniref:Uncharacterized protein B003R n=1 Tax=Paramecium bursaria Chlorella virus NY2A TaxID=46021 RepID=A7IVM8_PBCVN|nr:hypothetical protein NY2A_B003R [Paramecium bursaria Chlorella virus NY2A]YP_001498080.1 hypothetical protein NY2A_B884L [Paramecium bursaria Chlorella virus NY2A]ABT14402.1 hypothetical protein NY2A_B003R [Paramecium bursaria Chlorella virus NY2A]ABT15283.1 hypothetical protein NY2A_B884L [Paramecium bursaria Chlorella virus NY2A]